MTLKLLFFVNIMAHSIKYRPTCKPFRYRTSMDSFLYSTKNKTKSFEFEILTAAVMESSIFWDITPCNPVRVCRRLGGKNSFHLEGQRVSQARNQHEAGTNC
jgi:hypothetical protein